MTIKDAFVKEFGAELAERFEDAAAEHRNGINDQNLGSDPFKWVLLIVIGYECASKPEYAAYHHICCDWAQVDRWIIAHGDLASHEGDCDYLRLMTGAYNKYVGKEPLL